MLGECTLLATPLSMRGGFCNVHGRLPAIAYGGGDILPWPIWGSAV